MRARALRGDFLDELTDSEREWVWRSLLLGIRLDQSLALAGISHDQLTTALERIRLCYARRLEAHCHA